MSSNSSDVASSLLDRARLGSTSSLGRLMTLYRAYLKAVVTARLDERLRTRVSGSDVVQETFFEAHRDFDAFRGQSPEEFIGWMRKILVNNLMRVVERNVTAAKRDVRREISLDRVVGGVDQSADRLSRLAISLEATPSTAMRQQESQSALALALAALPEDYRTVVQLRNVEGLPFKEVACRMDRSGSAVRMLWLRAIKQLRSAINDSEGS